MKRLYVHESIYDRMCEELVSLAEEAVVGDGLEQGTQFGPLQNRMQFEKVKDIIDDAGKHGKVLAGRQRCRTRATSSAPPSCATSPTARGWWTRSSSARSCR